MAENLIYDVDILDESKECFLTYAEEVLTDRSIPNAEDGLLSSQRKILWTMEDVLGMSASGKTKKCNGVVGSTLSTSYYHGDASCYGVLTKLAQKYLMRYPLLIGQGALGTQADNSKVASSRYTECKPSEYTDLMMLDYKKNVVPTKESYNGEYMEPVFLPALFPNALCNGRQTIGISISHNSAPNNLTEVCNAIIATIQKGRLDIDELLTYMPGPDFPLKNTVINKKDIKTAFKTGHSQVSLKIRGEYEIKDNKIIFTTIPYRTYRNKIKEQIDKNIDTFSNLIDDFDDESEVGNNKLVFTVKQGVSHAKVLSALFELTDLQATLSYNMNFIVNGTPKMCSMFDLIDAYIEHQHNVLTASTQFDLNKAKARKHILDGLIAAVNQLDLVIEIIRNAENDKEAADKLIKLLQIDDLQAQAILDLKLRKISKLDRMALVKELEEKIAFIATCEELIASREKRNEVLIKKITSMRDKYGDARRTTLIDLEEPKEDEIPDVEPEKCVVILSESGTLKRIPADNFKVQKRAGKGVKTQNDITSMVLRTNTIDQLMVFTNLGQMYRILVNDIPEGNNTSKGTPISSLLELQPGEIPSTIYSIYRDTDAKYVFFTTKTGTVKKTALDEYVKTKKKNGIAAINLREGDSLASVTLVKDEPITLITKKGMMIRFNSTDVSATSRATIGIKGINLSEGDEVVAALVERDPNDSLAVFSAAGLGKKIAQTELTTQSRGGKGLICYKPTPTSGEIVAAAYVGSTDNILIVGERTSICVGAEDIPSLGRAGMGNTLIKGRIKAVSKI